MAELSLFQILCISSETLVSLTMRSHSFNVYQVELSAPSLCTFSFTGTPFQKLCGSSLSSVKQVNIDAEMLANYSEPPLVLLSWLSDLANIKSLTVSASTLQVLSFVPDLSKDKLLPSSLLCSLKSLKVKLKPLSIGLSMASKIVMLERGLKAGCKPSSLIPDGILDLLLQNSPSADVEFVECPRFDNSFDHLAPISSLLFPQFLQPSSNEHVVHDLQRRVHHLKQLEVQAKKYVDEAVKYVNEAAIQEREREHILALKEHILALKDVTMMCSKTVNVLDRQIRKTMKLLMQDMQVML